VAGTLWGALCEAAADSPDKAFIRTAQEELTYGQVHRMAAAMSHVLTARGVRRGDAVALLMGNSAEQVVLWFALNLLGAVHAPLNTALKGAQLQNALGISDPVLVVAEEDLLALHSTVLGNRGMTLAQLLGMPWQLFRAMPEEPRANEEDDPASDPLATATLLFTSGTTGRSKACMLSNTYLVRQGELHCKYLGLTGDDVLYTPFPLFHIDTATLTVTAALAKRATAALGRRFSAAGFWPEVRNFDATVFNFMGATLTILWKQPPVSDDRDNRVRLAWGVPLPAWHEAFETRFGLAVREVYGLTDAGVPVYGSVHEAPRPGRIGRVVDEYDLRIDPLAGSSDMAPAAFRAGEAAPVGEVLVRGREPGLVMNGYVGMPRETEVAIVDGWVRTGDLGSLDEDGYFAFHGRLTDSIRRRGENISALEVEELVTAHASVLEASAIGVPSELTEEDVAVFVVLRPGATLTEAGLHEHCLANGAAYMAPRYISFVNELPKTPTEKVDKVTVRSWAESSARWNSAEPDADARRSGVTGRPEHSSAP